MDYIPMIIILLFVAGIIALIVFYMKSFNAQRDNRIKQAEAYRQQHGGEYKLVWEGQYASGAADQEFGQLVVEIPKKRRNSSARFYEKGLVLDKKRLPYSEIKDIIFTPAKNNKKLTLKQSTRDMGVLWIYRKKGSTIGIRETNYQFNNEIMAKIKQGLGF